MPKTLLVVRAEIPDPRDRPKFDEWYRTDHLPLALKTFGAARGWRCWSRTDPATHLAFYEFAGPAEAEAATAPDRPAGRSDRVWGKRVARRREIPRSRAGDHCLSGKAVLRADTWTVPGGPA